MKKNISIGLDIEDYNKLKSLAQGGRTNMSKILRRYIQRGLYPNKLLDELNEVETQLSMIKFWISHTKNIVADKLAQIIKED